MSDEGYNLGEVKVVRTTDGAILVKDGDLDDETWIPKSVVHDDSEIYGNPDIGEQGEMIVETWFARKEGWT